MPAQDSNCVLQNYHTQQCSYISNLTITKLGDLSFSWLSVLTNMVILVEVYNHSSMHCTPRQDFLHSKHKFHSREMKRKKQHLLPL